MLEHFRILHLWKAIPITENHLYKIKVKGTAMNMKEYVNIESTCQEPKTQTVYMQNIAKQAPCASSSSKSSNWTVAFQLKMPNNRHSMTGIVTKQLEPKNNNGNEMEWILMFQSFWKTWAETRSSWLDYLLKPLELWTVPFSGCTVQWQLFAISSCKTFLLCLTCKCQDVSNEIHLFDLIISITFWLPSILHFSSPHNLLRWKHHLRWKQQLSTPVVLHLNVKLRLWHVQLISHKPYGGIYSEWCFSCST